MRIAAQERSTKRLNLNCICDAARYGPRFHSCERLRSQPCYPAGLSQRIACVVPFSPTVSRRRVGKIPWSIRMNSTLTRRAIFLVIAVHPADRQAAQALWGTYGTVFQSRGAPVEMCRAAGSKFLVGQGIRCGMPAREKSAHPGAAHHLGSGSARSDSPPCEVFTAAERALRAQQFALESGIDRLRTQPGRKQRIRKVLTLNRHLLPLAAYYGAGPW